MFNQVDIIKSHFNKHKNLLYELVKRDIKIKYRRSVLGVLWSLLQPLFLMIVLTIIFSSFFKRDIPNFPVYLLTGRLLYEFFSIGSRAAMRSIRRNASLIKKVYIPKYILPLSSVISNFIIFLISLIILMLTILVTDVELTASILYFFFPIIYLFIFTLGVGFILSTLTVFFKDFEHLYDIFLMIVMYASAIFYPAEIVPDKYRFILDVNPLFRFISLLRDSVLYGTPFNLADHLICLSMSVITLAIGVLLFKRNQDKFILHI